MRHTDDHPAEMKLTSKCYDYLLKHHSQTNRFDPHCYEQHLRPPAPNSPKLTRVDPFADTHLKRKSIFLSIKTDSSHPADMAALSGSPSCGPLEPFWRAVGCADQYACGNRFPSGLLGRCSAKTVAQVNPQLDFQVRLDVSNVSSTWRFGRAVRASGNSLAVVIDWLCFLRCVEPLVWALLPQIWWAGPEMYSGTRPLWTVRGWPQVAWCSDCLCRGSMHRLG
jgi:hypothetical protein